MRSVRGLKEVTQCPPPLNRKGGTAGFAPSAADGLRYERAVALYAASLGLRVSHGQWLKYRDASGVHYAQVDVLALPQEPDRLLVLEAKLTQKEAGEVKLKKVYVPLARALYQVPVFPILIFKNILTEASRQLTSLEDALRLPLREQGKVYHLHWSAL